MSNKKRKKKHDRTGECAWQRVTLARKALSTS